jgi:ribosomal protein L37E
MKKKYASISDQLSAFKPSSEATSKKEISYSYSKSLTPVKKETPCIDPYSGYLFFYFKNEKDAKSICDDLWDTASLSSKASWCEICDHFHLVDPNGLKLTSKEKVSFQPSGKRIYHDRCPSCTSSNGFPKAIFHNAVSARDALESLPIEIPYPMHLYVCPKGHGNHLTKNPVQYGSNYIATIAQRKVAADMLQNSNRPSSNKSAINQERQNKLPHIVRDTDVMADQAPVKKYICLGCGWKNQDNKLKCAACGELGPYISS